MPSEEGKQVLKLLADGKIDADQAYRLLRAIGDVEEKGRGDGAAPVHAPDGPDRPLFPPDFPSWCSEPRGRSPATLPVPAAEAGPLSEPSPSR